MRTTLTIDDKIAKILKETAHRSGKSYKQVVNEALRAGVAANRVKDAAKPYQLKPVSMGEVAGGYDLTKALQLSDKLEDEALTTKLELNK